MSLRSKYMFETFDPRSIQKGSVYFMGGAPMRVTKVKHIRGSYAWEVRGKRCPE